MANVSVYYCEVCERIETSENDDVDDTDMLCCEEGHFFCKDHIYLVDPREISRIFLEAMEDENIDEVEREFLEKKLDHRELLTQKAEELLRNHVFTGWPEDVPQEICPICSLSVIHDDLVVRKLLAQTGMSRLEAEDEIRTECLNLTDALETFIPPEPEEKD